MWFLFEVVCGSELDVDECSIFMIEVFFDFEIDVWGGFIVDGCFVLKIDVCIKFDFWDFFLVENCLIFLIILFDIVWCVILLLFENLDFFFGDFLVVMYELFFVRDE